MEHARILIVEDQNIIAMDLENRLTALGYAVVAMAASGPEAVARAEELKPDLVLMDIVLKGEMDGVQAAEQIRERHDLPVIYLTAHSDERTLERARLTGPHGYILKPFEDRELQLTIEIGLYKHRMEARLRGSERWLAATLMSIGEAVIATDEHRRIQFMNRVAEALTGWTQTEAMGLELSQVFQTRSEIAGVQSRTAVTRILQASPLPDSRSSLILITKDGKELPIDNSAAPIRDEKGRITGVVLVFRDVTEQRRAEQKLRLAAKVFESAAESILITDADTHIIAVNESFTAMTGYQPDEVLGQTPNILRSGKHSADYYQEVWRALEEAGQWQGEFWNRRKNGELYPQWSSINVVKNAQDEIVNYVGIFTDITTRKRDEERLRTLAYHDPLTGLPNRALFQALLNQAIASTLRHQNIGAVLFIDLDHFKNVNDTLGHSVGDRLLRQVAQRLTTCLRQSDRISRLGGDEFTVLLPQIAHKPDAVVVAQKVRAVLHEPFHFGGQDVFITASIGIANFPGDGNDVETLLKCADTALYRAKELGRNGYAVYTADMNAAALEQLALENGLRRALLRQEFVLYYQPRIAAATGQVVCVEALLRWQHPDLGLVTPGQFLELAEERGLIVPIGQWVLQTACAQAKAWQSAGYPGLRVSVNLSAQQFWQPDLIDQIANVLEETGLAPDSLELELTEGTMMQNLDDVIARLKALKQLGVHLSIDDFGTGYSSLEYLQRFPVDILKIDRSFLRELPNSLGDGAIVRAVIALAHTLQLKVTVEGVETAEQLGFLQTCNCDEMQGYYFSLPLAASELWQAF